MQSDKQIYPGPFCEEVDIKCSELLQNEDNLTEIGIPPRNGLVLELVRFAAKNKLPSRKVANWLRLLIPQCRVSTVKTLESRISRTSEMEKRFKKKKTNKTFKSLNDFQQALFIEMNPNEISKVNLCHDPLKEIVTHDNSPKVETVETNAQLTTEMQALSSGENTQKTFNSPTPSPLKERETHDIPPIVQKENIHSPESIISTYPSPIKETETLIKTPCRTVKDIDKSLNVSDSSYSSETVEKISKKDVNQLKYEMSKLQKQLNVLKNLVEAEKNALENLKSVSGHFSVRNVTKRDENARNTRKSLRQLKTACAKQQVEVDSLRIENNKLQAKLAQNESEKVLLTSNMEKLNHANMKKTKAQKQASHYRNLIKKVRENSAEDLYKYELKKKQDEIEYLQNENDSLKEQQKQIVFATKSEDGSYSENLRLCVMELFALEIGMEKIPHAIEVVGKHIFDYKFKSTELPTLSTTRNIVDEGHYLAKSFIATKIEKAENIGISRDGTTRRKEKIVDTSVTLNNGEVMSLGFSKVSRETAENINKVTKKQFTELAETVADCKETPTGTDIRNNISENFLAESLKKLSFTMSDRANNEKAADKLLNDWRDNVLTQCGTETEKKSVFQFHCMAHVLLGFHNYVSSDLKQFEKEIVAEQGPIGRDQLPMFKFWSKKQTVVERIAYTASSVFGPAGEHNGLRDRWDAYCASNGVKSLIGNYRDNRFNSLFQTAAEVFVHSEEFLKVIKTVPTPNQKIVSVEADLQSESVQTMLRVLTAIYVKITGPYWWLVTSASVPYLELYPYVQQLECFVDNCAENPNELFSSGNSWLNAEDMTLPHINTFLKKLSQPIPDTEIKFRNDFVGLVCKAILKTIRKQLVDFLEGGRYSTSPTKENLNRTVFAQVNNLSCEHHFGDLDSSQRRRPNSSFHHHSSVQMLKRNRKQLMLWLEEMPEERKKMVMKKARKGGVELRKRHREQEEEVRREISEIMEKGQKSKSRKINETDNNSEDEFEQEELSLQHLLPDMSSGFTENDYVAVAYQDAWYPGCVTKCINEDTASVSFMVPCRKPGSFFWPARKDVQTVEKKFVLQKNMLPECCNSGRQWYFPNFQEITDVYNKYKVLYFD